MIVDADVHRYRQGGCFAMAQALANLTGHEPRCIDFGSCVHAFVKTPDNDVIDIHGRHGWEEFIGFLVQQRSLPAHALEPGVVQDQPIPAPGKESVLWRHAGYKAPSQAAVRQATVVALRHPNLQGVIVAPVNQRRRASP